MVSLPETGSDSPIGSDRDRGRDNVCMVGALLLLRTDFDDDSALARSLLLNLFTRYLRDYKNNALSIFMLSSSIQFSLH